MSDEYVIPVDLANTPADDRIAWLLKDAQADAMMAGVPRYQPRYTPREHEIISFLHYAVTRGRA